MKRSVLVMLSLAVAACATTDPATLQVAATEASSPEQDTPYQVDDGATARNDVVEKSEPIVEMEAPAVEHIAAEEIPGRQEPVDAVVCTREVPTGSILPVKVCRHRAEVDAREVADQRMIDNIKRNQAAGAARPPE